MSWLAWVFLFTTVFATIAAAFYRNEAKSWRDAFIRHGDKLNELLDEAIDKGGKFE